MTAAAFSGVGGRIVRSSLLQLEESRYSGTLVQPMHGHEPAYFTSVIAGAYDERIGGRTTLVGAGSLLFHPPGEEHAVHFRSPRTRIFRLTANASLLDSARLAGIDLGRTPRRAPPALARVISRLRAAHARVDALTPLMVDALACELVVQIAGASTRRTIDSPAAYRARDLLETRLASPPSLAELARVAGNHPISLTRAFRRTFGCSVGEYVRRRRVEEACRALLESADPLAFVAARAGFADQAHLTRSLRRAIGVTPAALRRSLAR